MKARPAALPFSRACANTQSRPPDTGANVLYNFHVIKKHDKRSRLGKNLITIKQLRFSKLQHKKHSKTYNAYPRKKCSFLMSSFCFSLL